MKYKIHEGWLPTPENISALPDPVRRLIHLLETNTDPAHMVRENILIKDTCRALVIELEEKQMVTEEFVEKWAEKIVVNIFDREYTWGNSQTLKVLKQMLKEAGVKVVKG